MRKDAAAKVAQQRRDNEEEVEDRDVFSSNSRCLPQISSTGSAQ